MSTLDIIKQDQPVFYKELMNALSNHKLPHAFLITGDQSSLVAHYIAQCIVCDEDVACETCNTCQRILSHTYADLIYASGKEEKIKKEIANRIHEQFSKSSIEGKAKIYLLENIENATNETMNSLLKLLEEPEGDVYALFTTSNINKVLPTIISRCLLVNLLPSSKSSLMKQLEDHHCPKDNIQILSEMFHTLDECLPYLDNEDFDKLKLEVNYFVEDLFLKRDNLFIDVQTHLLKNYNNKSDLHLFMNMLVIELKDLILFKYNLPVVFNVFKSTYKKININEDDILNKIEKILEYDAYIDANANTGLLFDSMMYEL